MPQKDLGVYIHIPFCVSKCIYCDFLSAPSDDSTKERYVKALLEEIKEFAALHGDNYIVKSVFFGGGTPSVLKGGYIYEITECLRHNFSFDKECEITIECNPGTVDDTKLHLYRECGINRLSFGLQSTDNRELKMLGRIHTYEDFLKSLELSKKAGFTNINADLMSALPCQTIDSWERTLREVASLGIPHISAYSLIIEENTPLCDMVKAGKELFWPSEDEERDMYYATKEILESFGMERYEISNYAQKGYECIHNIRYWTRGDYAGFGIGAASFIKGMRYSNTRDIKEYINVLSDTGTNSLNHTGQIKVPHYEEEYVSREDAMAEFMFLGLRMSKGVNYDTFRNEFGVEPEKIYQKEIDKLVSDGLLERKGKTLKLTPKGVDVSNIVFAEFLLT
ncbi:MAG: radical SAM family heme chaperone HemW [Butyrivibrio sp.]